MSCHDKNYSEAEMLDAFYAGKQYGINALGNSLNIQDGNNENKTFFEWLEEYKDLKDIHTIDKVVEYELDARNEAE
jgi:hypothetical protein